MLWFVFQSKSQSLYIEYYSIKPQYPPNYQKKEFGGVICSHCPGETFHLDSIHSMENEKAIKFNKTVQKLRTIHIGCDSMQKVYRTQDSVLELFKSELFSAYTTDLLDYPFHGPNQNKSSPECKLNKGDSAVGTIRYRVVCIDCPFPKKRKLYYIFYYDKNGMIVRHGLAYLKKGKISKQ